jgi:uncharacterized protein with FMN-binding domain
MKRALLIAGGTIGGIGAVLSITPPQLSSHGMSGLGLGSGVTSGALVSANSTTSQSPTAAVPQSATPVVATSASAPASSATAVKKKQVVKKKSSKVVVASHKAAKKTVATPAKSATPTKTRTAAQAPAPTATKTQAPAPAPAPTATKTQAPAPVSKGVSGTFTGSAINVNYGIVQVQITVSNGKITDAQAIQAPSGRSGQFSTYALPILRQETLTAQSSQIQGVSGASYTSYGWYTSLVAALAKAGL